MNVKYYQLQTKKTSEHFRAIWNALKHSLPVSQIDFLKNGVEIWSWLALVVFIEEYRRSAKLQPQLLDSLLIIQRHQEELRVPLSLDRGHQREVLRESRIYKENSKALFTYNTMPIEFGLQKNPMALNACRVVKVHFKESIPGKNCLVGALS